MSTDDGPAPDELSPRERARLRTRDRKRTTPMVVDNAGIKRTAQALARRRAAARPAPSGQADRDPGA
ncbi:MAG TPA: hypothetical protein VG520_01275 [Candidatus Dormibacteraeota bacterium]|jgi:hypothetical protein|nr:hypothetical protein [Candidatus Dormibacteraeota bacterium]